MNDYNVYSVYTRLQYTFARSNACAPSLCVACFLFTLSHTRIHLHRPNIHCSAPIHSVEREMFSSAFLYVGNGARPSKFTVLVACENMQIYLYANYHIVFAATETVAAPNVQAKEAELRVRTCLCAHTSTTQTHSHTHKHTHTLAHTCLPKTDTNIGCHFDVGRTTLDVVEQTAKFINPFFTY